MDRQIKFARLNKKIRKGNNRPLYKSVEFFFCPHTLLEIIYHQQEIRQELKKSSLYIICAYLIEDFLSASSAHMLAVTVQLG